MGEMKEEGMERQQEEELGPWDRLDCLITKHGLQEKFEEWGMMHGLGHALHNLKDTLTNLGESGMAKLIDPIIQEVGRVKESCSEGCKCGHEQEDKNGVSGDAVITPAQTEAVQQEKPIEEKEVFGYKPIMPNTPESGQI